MRALPPVVLVCVLVAVSAGHALYRESDLTRAWLGIDRPEHEDHSLAHVHPRKLLLHNGVRDSRTEPDVHGLREDDGVLSNSWSRLFTRSTEDDGAPSTFMVQFASPITRESRQALEAEFGIKFGPYVPHHTLLVHCTTAVARALALHRAVAFVGPHHAELKITRGLQAFLDSAADQRARPHPSVTRSRHVHGARLYVVLSPAEHGRSLDAALDLAAAWQRALLRKGEPVSVQAESPDKLVVQADGDVSSTLVAWLAHQREAFLVELAPVYKLANKFSRWLTQSGSQDVYPFFDAGIRGQGQIVGCADSGLDWDNCLFAHDDSSSVSPGAAHRKVFAYEVMPGNDATDDVSGHGTHVVGSIVGKAVGPNANTIGAWNGMAQEAKVYFQDIGETGGGLNVPADLNTGLFPSVYAAGARIHSDSWGSATPTYDSNAAEMDTFMYAHDDFLVLVAAGNDGASVEQISSTIGSPATSKNCLAVGASQTSNAGFTDALNYVDWAARTQEAIDAGISDCCSASPKAQEYCCRSAAAQKIASEASRYQQTNVAPFSSRGPTADGRIKPEILAPGQEIVSAHSDGSGNNGYHCNVGEPAGANSGALLAMAGTSMATPVTAGLATLVRQYYVEGWYGDGTVNSAPGGHDPSAALVKATLINSAVPLSGQIDVGNNGTWIQLGDIPSVFQGFGKVQLDRTLKLRSSAFSLYFDDASSVSTESKNNYCIAATGSADIKVTLVWTDPAGSPSAELALVNNLDLFMGTDATTITGNWQTKKDTRNTVEQNIIRGVLAGTTYKVQVHGRNVPQGPQRYALVITGAFSSVTTSGCTYAFVDNFEDQTKAQAFPLGAVAGGLAGASALALIGMCVAAFLKSQQSQGGRQAGQRSMNSFFGG